MTKQDVLKLEARLLLMVPRLGMPVVIVMMAVQQVLVVSNMINGVLDASSS